MLHENQHHLFYSQNNEIICSILGSFVRVMPNLKNIIVKSTSYEKECIVQGIKKFINDKQLPIKEKYMAMYINGDFDAITELKKTHDKNDCFKILDIVNMFGLDYDGLESVNFPINFPLYFVLCSILPNEKQAYRTFWHAYKEYLLRQPWDISFDIPNDINPEMFEALYLPQLLNNDNFSLKLMQKICAFIEENPLFLEKCLPFVWDAKFSGISMFNHMDVLSLPIDEEKKYQWLAATSMPYEHPVYDKYIEYRRLNMSYAQITNNCHHLSTDLMF